MFYRVCPCCGSNLDPGERCECRKIAKKKEEFLTSLFESSEDGQIRMKVEDFEYAGNQCIS